MFTPLMQADTSAQILMTPERASLLAQSMPLSQDIADFDRVIVTGDFQSQLGCGDWDAYCDQSRLQNNGGFWTGAFGVGPGVYNWEMVGFDRSGAQYSLQSGQVNVAEGQTGVYFEFNGTNRSANAWAVTHVATANGPFGTVALAQEGDGFVASSINASSDGPASMNVSVNGASVQTTAQLNEGSNRVHFDGAGNVTYVEDLGFAEVTIERADASGNPATGSCFVLEGNGMSRGCDTDDGNPDGRITLRFPAGFTPGSYTLRETRPADGQEPLQDQQVDVQEGRSTIQAQAEEQAGDIVVLRQDNDGNPVGGACFEVLDANGQVVGSACDEDGDVPNDGRTGIVGIPAGSYTLRETRTPEGYEPASETQVTVTANQSVDAPVRSAQIVVEQPTEVPTEEPTEVPTDEPIDAPTEAPVESPTDAPIDQPGQPGDIVVLRQDATGAPVGGACFEVLDANGLAVGSACDEDGDVPDDGRIGIFGIPAGTYTLRETRTPNGYQSAADTQVTVVANQAVDAPVQSAADSVEQPTQAPIDTPTEEPTAEATDEAAQPGDLVIYRTDENGTMVGGACFEVIDASGQQRGTQCDEDGFTADDGVTGIYGIPEGTYTLRETRTPEGYAKADDTQVTIAPGIQNEITVSGATSPADQPTEAPIDEPTTAPTDAPIDQPTEAPIDEPTTAPTDAPIDQPTEAPIDEPTAAPTDVPPAEPTSEPTADQGGTGTALVITYPYEDGQPQVCIEVETGGSIGMLDMPYACDNGDNDMDPAQGTIRMENVSAGEYFVTVYQGPDSMVQAESKPVIINEGQASSVSYEAAAPTTTQLTINATDGTNPVADVCVTLNTGESTCTQATGSATIDGIQPGDYTLTVTSVPQGFTTPDPMSVTVAADGSTMTTVTLESALTSLEVVTVDQATNDQIGNACYSIDGGATQHCDDDGNGDLQIENVEPGEYTLTNTSAPDGYETADPMPVNVTSDGAARVDVGLREATTDFVVMVTDGTNPLADVCFALTTGETACSDAEGRASFSGVASGENTLTVTDVPTGFTTPDPQAITIAADGSTSVPMSLSRATTYVIVRATDEQSGQPVVGVCFSLDGGATQSCDTDENGAQQIDNVLPGSVTVSVSNVPEGYDTPQPQEFTVSGEGGDVFTIVLVRSAVDLTVNTLPDVGDEKLTGACYTLDGGDPVCDDDANGTVVFTGVTNAEHTLVMSTAPEGYATASEQVVAAGTTSVDVRVTQLTGDITVTITDDAGASLPGACIAVNGGTPQCDDDNNGQIDVLGLAPGEYSVAVTTVPNGYDLPADAQNASVVGNETAQVNFQIATTPPTTGGLDVTTLFDDESSATGVCVTVTQAGGGEQFQACDGDAADTNPADGVIGFDDLPVGVYEVAQTEGSTVDRASAEQPVMPVSVTIEGGTRASATLYIPLAPSTGTVVISVREGELGIPGACFTFGNYSVCDNDASDVDGREGYIQVNDVEPGDYSIVMSTVPAGFETPAAQNATVVAGGTTQNDFSVVRIPEPGTVTVRTMDADNDPLGNTCYALVQNGNRIGTQCDASDSSPNDGTVTFTNVTAGSYQVVQTQAPSNRYSLAPSVAVDVEAGQTTTIDIVMDLRPGRLTVTTVDRDETTLVLQNACYTLVGASTFGPFCDADDGSIDGRVRFTNVPAGTYELRQTVAAAGYDPAANRSVTITAGGALQITVLNAKVAPPAQSGTLVVRPLDPNGASVAGGCYQVFNGDNPVSQRVCDNADATPGSITISNLPVGRYTLREQLAPSPDWRIAADIQFSVVNGETTTVEVPHAYKNGTVVVQVVNSVGLPLRNACFTLSNSTTTHCTDGTGQLTVSNLAPGTLRLKQISAPFGYKVIAAQRDVIVRPGQTTVIRLTLENQPPPNTGTVQVQKFICPVEPGGERTTFLGGAQGNNQLKQTAGCRPGIATFTLVAENGSRTSNAEFRTNSEGRAQVTAENGIYLLTETDPDLRGNSAARIRVGTGQMTTVIVINYVEPPKPAPVTINVEGYTCPPGFTGSTFADFQASCMAPGQLTNQITVRAESVNRYKRVTGDTGAIGKTTFTNLPAGTYTIWAERAYTMPLNYVFCGPDPNAPTLKAVNGSVVTTQQAGTNITCRVFQVPSLYDANNGAIQVQKYNCPITERQRGYDYRNECTRATQPVSFEIQLIAKDSTGQPVRMTTNTDGIVQFPMLRPGVYKLTEVGGQWCFAQSNSVDAQGNVIVNANKLSEVWVYNCVGPTAPPNTGSGDAADLLNPTPTVGPMQVVPNLVWPAVLLAAWIGYRNRHTQA